MAERQLPGMLGKGTRRRHPELVSAMWRMLAAAPLDGVLQALEAMAARPDSTPTLPTITVPTLFVSGAQDVIVPSAEMRAMQALVRGSAIEVIAGTGHACNFERPAAFNHLMGDFLGALDAN
jgi:3-oxoadipate enol-lactonase